MSHATDIVGYTFDTEQFCLSCIVGTLGTSGDAALINSAYDSEQWLNETARVEGVDRQDEGSYDSSDFPKVLFDSQVHSTERCDGCGEHLIGE